MTNAPAQAHGADNGCAALGRAPVGSLVSPAQAARRVRDLRPGAGPCPHGPCTPTTGGLWFAAQSTRGASGPPNRPGGARERVVSHRSGRTRCAVVLA